MLIIPQAPYQGFLNHNNNEIWWNFNNLINCTTYKNFIRFHMVVTLSSLVKKNLGMEPVGIHSPQILRIGSNYNFGLELGNDPPTPGISIGLSLNRQRWFILDWHARSLSSNASLWSLYFDLEFASYCLKGWFRFIWPSLILETDMT